MKTTPIRPQGDARVQHCHALVNGKRYHYLLAHPQSAPIRATVFLIHGWPDLSLGWRYQIPLLVESFGLRVVCPDLLGFGGSDAPTAKTADDLSFYSMKRASDDIAELARQLGADRIILGGHDWGGAVVYRCALWHPDLVSHVFAVCTPYQPPTKPFVSLDMVVERAAQFGYQKHLAGPEVEANVTSKTQIRQFLSGMYGARGPKGQTMFTPEHGIIFKNLPGIGKSSLLTDEELDYYVDEYARHGLHGTLNWYRTREVNWREEKGLNTGRIDIPVLFIQADRDAVLLPSLSRGMEASIPNLTRKNVDAGHWALWQAAEAVNGHLHEWFTASVFGAAPKL